LKLPSSKAIVYIAISKNEC